MVLSRKENEIEKRASVTRRLTDAVVGVGTLEQHLVHIWKDITGLYTVNKGTQ